MATSGSTDYSETRSSIIKDALIEIGAHDVSETVDAETGAYAARKLNRMLKAWQADGINLWRLSEGNVALVASQASYTMGGTGSPDVAYRPLRIHEVRYRDANGTDRPMVQLSRSDYFDLPEKTSTGSPTSYYYDPGRGQGTLYIWPVPASVTTESLRWTYDRSIEDMDAAANEPDVPQEWYDAVVLNLAASLAGPTFPTEPGLQQIIEARAQRALDRAMYFDRETASVSFSLDMSGR